MVVRQSQRTALSIPCLLAMVSVLLIAGLVAVPHRAQAEEPVYNGTIYRRGDMVFNGPAGQVYGLELRQDDVDTILVLVRPSSATPGVYRLVLYDDGRCPATWMPADAAIIDERAVELATDLAGYVLRFDTRAVSLARETPNTIFDSDGTALAVFAPDGSLVGCADLLEIKRRFNSRVVLEFAVAFMGTDGHQHYVTLSQDTGGMVAVRLQLTKFLGGPHTAVTYNRAACVPGAAPDQADVVETQLLSRYPDDPGSSAAFGYATEQISISTGVPNSIYDADGASVAVYRPDGQLLGCADISSVEARPPETPVAPATGSGLADPVLKDGHSTYALVGLLLTVCAVAAVGMARRRA